VVVFAAAVHFGLVAVALAFVVRNVLTFPLVLWLMRRAIGTPVLRILGLMAGPVIASIIMFAAVSATRQLLPPLSPGARLPLLIASGGASYVLVMILIARKAVRRLIETFRSSRRGAAPAGSL
jgi:PST family polysaccharide transporter